jgi:NTP pyrophosphatase (non-canonical NTP hydrolase)
MDDSSGVLPQGVSDSATTIDSLKAFVARFCEARDWDQFHGAKDLSIGLITEASELLEHFRFKSDAEVEALFRNGENKAAIEAEMADTFFFLLRLAQKYDVDLIAAFAEKMRKNGERYSVERARGSNRKLS